MWLRVLAIMGTGVLDGVYCGLLPCLIRFDLKDSSALQQGRYEGHPFLTTLSIQFDVMIPIRNRVVADGIEGKPGFVHAAAYSYTYH